MTTLALTLQLARIKLWIGRYLATRAALRAVRRAVDWLARLGDRLIAAELIYRLVTTRPHGRGSGQF